MATDRRPGMVPRAATAILVLLGTVACQVAPGTDGADGQAPPAGAAGLDGTIRFGAGVSDTGKYSHEGRDTREGYETWLEWVNEEYGGIRIGDRRFRAEIIFYDDESDPGRAAALTERLIVRDDVDFMLGPYSSGLNAAASAIAERHRTILVTGTASADSLSTRGFRYFFTVMTDASRYTESALQALAEAGADSVVVAYEDTEFPIDAGEGAVHHARRLGMEVLAVETYPRFVTDVSGIVAKFRQLEPDVFVGAGYYVDALMFMRAAEEQGFSPAAMVMTVGPSNPSFADELGRASELVIGPTQWEASMEWNGPWFGSAANYAARYRDRLGEPPTYQAASATAAALILQLGIEQAGSLETDRVRDALLELDVETFYGPVRFDPSGRNIAKPMGAVQIQDGRLELVTPAQVATASLIYPRLDDR